MNLHRSVSAVLLASIALLAVLSVALGTADAAPRADLVGPAANTSDTPLLAEPGSPRVETPLPATSAGPGSPPPRPPAFGDGTAEAQLAEDHPWQRRIGVGQPSAPRNLSIPSLGIDSPVVPVGLEDDGTMQLPGASEAGWYLPGRIPGSATGSAVIAAHVDYEGSPGVFIDLRSIEVGSQVLVTDLDGTVHDFTVSERYQVEKSELPVGELFRSAGEPVLTLVTCGGAFDPDDRSYADNIVVRAVPSPA